MTAITIYILRTENCIIDSYILHTAAYTGSCRENLELCYCGTLDVDVLELSIDGGRRKLGLAPNPLNYPARPGSSISIQYNVQVWA
jgi:hypothetical protein